MTFDQLLKQEHSFSIHQQNIQRLIIEICKAFSSISESILGEFFIRKKSGLKLRSQASVKSVGKGQSSLRCYKLFTWNSLSYDIRNAGSLLIGISLKIKALKNGNQIIVHTECVKFT